MAIIEGELKGMGRGRTAICLQNRWRATQRTFSLPAFLHLTYIFR